MVAYITVSIAALALALAGTTLPAREKQACPALSWTTLGTAGGPMPTAERAEPANLLRAGDQQILVDTGDGTVNQLARIGQTLGPIRAVFISHHHLDHTGGLAAVIGLRWMNTYPGQLTIYGPPGTREMVDGIIASMAPQARVGFGLGAMPSTPASSVRVVEMQDGSTQMLEGLAITSAANSHFDHDGPLADNPPVSLSYRFTLAGRSIAYTGDTGPSAATTSLAKGADMLVSEVIDLERTIADIQAHRKDAPPQMLIDIRQHFARHHLSASDVGMMAHEAGVGELVVTHFAIPGPLAQAANSLRTGIARHYSGKVSLARDLSSYVVDCK